VSQNFDLDSDNNNPVHSNEVLKSEALHSLRASLAEVETTHFNSLEPNQRLRLLDVLTLTVLFGEMFNLTDKKVLGRMWDIFKRVIKR